MPKTVEELEAELATMSTELSGAKDRIKELNGESGGHRGNYQREKKAREDLQAQLDAVTAERDSLTATHAADLDRQRIDLTAKSADAERRANETVAEYKSRRTDMDLQTTATRLGMHDLEGLKLLDRSALKVGDDGAVEDAEKVLTAFKEAKPYFFGAAPKPGTVTGHTSAVTRTPQQAAATTFDARTATPEQLQGQKAALGIH